MLWVLCLSMLKIKNFKNYECDRVDNENRRKGY